MPRALERALPFKSKDKLRENKLLAAQLRQKSALTKTLQTERERKVG